MTKNKDNEKQHKYNTRSKQNMKKKKSSDDGSDDDFVLDNFIVFDDDKEEKFDFDKYREFLAERFPSKYSKERAKNCKNKSPKRADKSKTTNKKSKKQDKKKVEDDTHDEEENVKYTIVEKKKNKKKIEDDDDTPDDEDEDDTDEESDEDDEGKYSEFKIILNLDLPEDFDFDDDSDDSDYDDDSDEEEEEKKPKRKKKKNVNAREDDQEEEEEEDDEEDDEDKIKPAKNQEEYDNNTKALEKMEKMINKISDKEKENMMFKMMINRFDKLKEQHAIDKKNLTKKSKEKNTKKFKKMMREKELANDIKYFKNKLSLDEQEKLLNELTEMKKYYNDEKPYSLKLLETDIPVHYKAIAYRKINALKFMEPGAGEYYKIKHWVNKFMSIPFNQYKNLPISINDGVDKCSDFIVNAKKTLDDAVHGLDDAKLQIMQLIGQWITNPEAIGNAIAIKGPMGTGKTTLVKEGISKILGRDFAFIALGGATDSSFLEGHSYTYEGSTCGKIVDILIRSKSMNPVIFFDELDKVSNTPRGDEIIGILTHLTDTTQNSKFHDKYFSEIDFDLSRALFIFSYNDEKKINAILRDRMYHVKTEGYNADQKIIIANNYLLPKIRKQINFSDDDITIERDVLNYIIANHTSDEKGVRNFKRCLEIIHTKLNLYRLMKPGVNIFEKEDEKKKSLKIEFPINVTKEIVDKFIQSSRKGNESWRSFYL